MNNPYQINTVIPGELNSEDAKVHLMNAIYNISDIFYENIGEYGKLTDGKKIQGNGHHIAQLLAKKAGELWDERLVDTDPTIKSQNKQLLETYMWGFNDELKGCEKMFNPNPLLQRAYDLGRMDAIVGDDVSSLDQQTDKMILNRIRSEQPNL
jgi:hypothetical protein